MTDISHASDDWVPTLGARIRLDICNRLIRLIWLVMGRDLGNDPASFGRVVGAAASIIAARASRRPEIGGL